MTKKIRLSEKALINLIEKTINEQIDGDGDGYPGSVAGDGSSAPVVWTEKEKNKLMKSVSKIGKTVDKILYQIDMLNLK
jgi:hypothetical protein